MKIVTCNIPEAYIGAIAKLVGVDGIYPSRSELIRVAVREFLLKELKIVKDMARSNEPELEEIFDDENYVRVPVEKIDENGEKKRKFEVYKILERLD